MAPQIGDADLAFGYFLPPESNEITCVRWGRGRTVFLLLALDLEFVIEEIEWETNVLKRCASP